ncbi:MAG: sensor domain-containing diguanylate cyclase [Desulfobacteraceae bacterium]|nr:sensor domain-containing diguanylate cyclase [Desulfobacteraceae bacterium]
MNEKILIISNQAKDGNLFKQILGSKGFDIVTKPVSEGIEDIFLNDNFGAILADYDQVGDLACSWINLLQENRSQSCVILYGENKKAEKIFEILQAGIYGFISRSNISKRIYETILGGMENRKAFIEILGMFNTLKNVNESIEREKEDLRKKNQELTFINRLTTEVAYDLNWSLILPRILNAGFLDVMNPALLGMLYRIGSKWNMAFHLSEKEINKKIIDRLKKDMINKFFSISGERVSIKDTDFHLYSSSIKISSADAIPFSKQIIMPLSLAGSTLGMLAILPENNEQLNDEKMELLTTISNILSMSLKNAQEYHKLKEMAVKDGLTGILNRKGFQNFIQKEFHRAKRYHRPLSLIMIDVDNFKKINDSIGHQAGDYVLLELAGCLKRSIRQADIVFRYGGDEFVILLPDTDMEQAKMLLKRVLSDVEKHAFDWESHQMNVKISCGISTTGELENHEDEKDLISKADTRLYSAKRSQDLKYCMA